MPLLTPRTGRGGGGRGREQRTIPVVNHVREHAASLPPIIRLRQVSGVVAGSVTGVVAHHVARHGLRRGFDRTGIVDVQLDAVNSLHDQGRQGQRQQRKKHCCVMQDCMREGGAKGCKAKDKTTKEKPREEKT